jgi:predicted polyphosphate/ATP-dependent NAD kinase
MGGAVGLKGTDGTALQRSRDLGAVSLSPARATEALLSLFRVRHRVDLITASGLMGEEEARAAGFDPRVVGGSASQHTTSEDTRLAASALTSTGVDLLLFAGGDGTARDVFASTDGRVPVIGIPTGVKIHSAVFAVSPRAAGELAVAFLSGEARTLVEAEVMDIDEDAFRGGRVSAKLFGYLPVPKQAQLMQGAKARSVNDEAAMADIAGAVIASMEPAVQYVIGPGTTTNAIKRALDSEGTLLGVDIFRDRQLIAKDVNEREVVRLVKQRPSRIVVSPIGGQGFIFGRGNQQISASAIRTVGIRNIVVVATVTKIASLRGRPLRVDTNDRDLDADLTGYMRVVTGSVQEAVYEVCA